MKIEIKIPPLGESITEAVISHVLVSSGTSVKMDQEIVEIETEKVNQVLYAPKAGLLNLSIREGETVKIGQVIGSVDTEANTSSLEHHEEEKKSSVESPKEESPKVEQPVIEKPSEIQKEKESSLDPSEKKALTSSASDPSFDTIRKSPESFLEELRAPQVKQNAKNETPKREERKKMSKIRQTIARRLVESKQTMAMLTTFNEVDMSRVIELRKKYQDQFVKKHQIKLGFMSFFVKAVTEALKQFPALNAYIDGEEIVYRQYYDVNVAISSDRGLVVPVIENCDQLSYADIEKKILDLSKKAKENKLSMDEMRSGGFTITNGGIFGSSFSTPIVNPPQSGILGMHKIAERACVINGQVVARPIMILALSYDHRIVDGKEGVSFLAKVVEMIEDPACLLMDL